MSSLELQQAISTELGDNPALEMIDVPTCPCAAPSFRGASVRAASSVRRATSSPRQLADGGYEEQIHQRVGSADEEFDPLTLVAAEETLAERLLADLGSLLDDEDMRIAEFLVGSLDDKGYLSCTVDEVAYELDVEARRVRRVLETLQGLEPVGVGARSLRECLLIQIDFLARNGVEQPYAREVIDGHLMELGERKFGRIAQELHISTDTVSAVWEFVKTKLNPHPAHGYSSTNDRDRDTRAMYILPDVIVNRKEDGAFEIDVVESKRFFLRINPMYAQLGATATREVPSLDSDDRRHVQQYVSRAKLFIANINQRRQTLYNITRCLVERQREFLCEGIRHLKPLSRAAIAEELGIHESTVSRATAAKYVMIPTGEVIPLATSSRPR